MAKATGAGARKGARKRAGAKRSRGAATAARRGGSVRQAPEAPGPSSTTSDPYAERVTLAEVAARANEDPDFFVAVAESVKDPNRALRRFDLKLSPRDAATLRKGLRQVIEIGQAFDRRGGWGAWPTSFKF
jgi:hypothetical protein